MDPKLNLKHLQGDFFVWEGETPALQPNESFSFSYQSRSAFLKNSYPPEGLILAHADGKVEEISQTKNEVIYGEGLTANQNFSSYKIFKIRGVFNLNNE